MSSGVYESTRGSSAIAKMYAPYCAPTNSQSGQSVAGRSVGGSLPHSHVPAARGKRARISTTPERHVARSGLPMSLPSSATQRASSA